MAGLRLVGIVLIFGTNKAFSSSSSSSSLAGGTYKKVANAIKDLDYEITADNAKGLGKGKTKVDGIGKGSSEKIHEFLETGKMAKLEEKRAGQV